MMREGSESESWDRLAYWITVYLSGQGNKNVKLETFHKFMQTSKGTFTKEKLHSMKNHFPTE